MRLPKYDILIPTLFVAVIFPAGAGSWWRYFSGYADQAVTPVVHNVVHNHEPAQVAMPAVTEPQDVVLLAHLAHSGPAPASSLYVAKAAAIPAKPDPWPASPKPLTTDEWSDLEGDSH